MNLSARRLEMHYPPAPRADRPARRLGVMLAISVGAALAVSTLVSNLSTAFAQTAPALPAPAATASPDMGETELADLSAALATRFGTAAHEVLRPADAVRDRAAWELACTYLEAAERLDPSSPRYPRLRAMALFDLGEGDAAAAAMTRYLKLKPDDDIARLRLIEHYAATRQSTDKKLEYYRVLLANEGISAEIRSRVATWAASTLLERSRGEAVQMVNAAIELDPLNVYARRLEYVLVAAYGTPAQRMQSLLAQLRCNPSQVQVLVSIGRELAAAGLTRDGTRWYGSALAASDRAQERVDLAVFTELAALLFLEGRPSAANDLLTRLLQQDVDITNIDAWLLKLVVSRANADGKLNVAYDQDLNAATVIFTSRLVELVKKIQLDAQSDSPATQPTSRPSSPVADITSGFRADGGTGPLTGGQKQVTAPTRDVLQEVIDRLKQTDASPFLKGEFIAGLIDMAWFEAYFARSADKAQFWTDGLAQLIGDTSPTVLRLRGHIAILRNNDAEAMKLLWDIRRTDPLAALGVAELLSRREWVPSGPTTGPAVKNPEFDRDTVIQRLLDEYPAGVIGALVAGHFKDRKLYARPGSNAAGLLAQINAFPKDFLDVVVRPELFYAPSGRAIGNRYRLGEPMFADVALTNRSDFDLPIGPDGIIKPDLWLDARVVLETEEAFPMSGSDRLAGPLVLRRRSAITQPVRIDNGPVGDALHKRPAATVDVFVTVMTNPQALPNFRVIAGPGGVRREFEKKLIRGGTPIGQDVDRRKIYDALAKGLPSDRLWAIDVLSAHVMQTRGNDIDRSHVVYGREFNEQVVRAQNDGIPQISAWATLKLVKLLEPDRYAQKVREVEQMTRSAAWEGRLLAVWAASELQKADRMRIVETLTNDASDLVRQAAKADLTVAKNAPVATGPTSQPAATQPTTPATQPTTSRAPFAPGNTPLAPLSPAGRP